LTNSWYEEDGVTYYSLSNGACAIGTVEIPTVNENGETITETYVFDENGALIGKA
jgi:glucan-binding YG repeat protein